MNGLQLFKFYFEKNIFFNTDKQKRPYSVKVDVD